MSTACLLSIDIRWTHTVYRYEHMAEKEQSNMFSTYVGHNYQPHLKDSTVLSSGIRYSADMCDKLKKIAT